MKLFIPLLLFITLTFIQSISAQNIVQQSQNNLNIDKLQKNKLFYETLLAENKLINDSALLPFFNSLKDYAAGKRNKIEIAHFGDSHVQIGHWTEQIRNLMDTIWGISAYGSTFPYQIAKFFPRHVTSQVVKGTWSGSSIIRYNDKKRHGLTGFTLETKDTIAEISVKLNMINDAYKQFDQVSILFSDPLDIYKIKVTGNQDFEGIVKDSSMNITKDGDQWITYHFPTYQDSIHILVEKSDSIFGTWSLHNIFFDKKDKMGIILNNYGVSGALLNSLENGFERLINQLDFISPDLIIFSFGSNEAYSRYFDNSKYLKLIDIFSEVIHKRYASVAILFTTPPDTKYKNINPPNLNTIVSAFREKAYTNNFACWDLHKIMKLTGGLSNWLRYKLASTDKLHFTKTGYQLHAYLLAQAIVNTYKKYVDGNIPFGEKIANYIFENIPIKPSISHLQ